MEETMNTSAFELTPHAMMRLAQRGFRNGDAEWIMAIGTEVEGGYLVREKDVLDAERGLKHLLQRVHRLRGKRLVVEGNTVVTGYPARPGKQRKLLKNKQS